MTELTQETVRELLDYDSETGVFTWKPRARHWFKSDSSFKVWNSKYSGKEAGSERRNEKGYVCREIGVFGKGRLAHRIAYLWMTGSIPDEVDHINHVATDNRWCNLRSFDSFRNNRSHSMRSNNKSGVTGVLWHKSAGKWRAEIMSKGVKYHLGMFSYEDLDIAAMEVLEFRIDHGFDPSHGIEFAHYSQRRNCNGQS